MKNDSTERGSLVAWVIAVAIALVSVLLALGLAGFFLHGSAGQPFRPQGFLAVLVHAGRGITHFDPRALIEAGLVALLLTPVSRLVAGAIQSARGRDWRFVIIGGIVVALLIGGITLGAG